MLTLRHACVHTGAHSVPFQVTLSILLPGDNLYPEITFTTKALARVQNGEPNPQLSVPSEWWREEKQVLEIGGKSHVRATKDGAEPGQVTMGWDLGGCRPSPSSAQTGSPQTGLPPQSETR